MAEVVPRERRHAGRGASVGERRPEAVAAEHPEGAPLGNAVLARHELAHGLEEDRRNSDPPGTTGL
jgi:hypothetical protein